jgi:hypothetical protein
MASFRLRPIAERRSGCAVERIDAFHEDHQIGAANSRKRPGVTSELVARLELAFVFEPALLGPGRQEQRQREDRREERGAEPENRTQAGGEPYAGGEPDDHFAIPIPAHERQQHGDVDRDR